MKNTPGPWIVAPWNVFDESNGHLIKGETKNICAVILDRGKCTVEENDANAKLIAAAPDLLNALKTLKEWVGRLDDWKGVDPPCEIVDEAIKKATDESE